MSEVLKLRTMMMVVMRMIRTTVMMSRFVAVMMMVMWLVISPICFGILLCAFYTRRA